MPTPISIGLYDIMLRFSYYVQIPNLIDIYCELFQSESESKAESASVAKL